MTLRVISGILLIMVSFMCGNWFATYNEPQTQTSLNVPLTLGNNIRRAYTLRTRDMDVVDIIEFATDNNDYCVLAITEVTISGAQSVALDCVDK